MHSHYLMKPLSYIQNKVNHFFSRLLGRRPTVRGSVMNAADHPHGGGEGRCPIGNPQPRTPWGKPALGVKTRTRKKYSDNLILRRRKVS